MYFLCNVKHKFTSFNPFSYMVCRHVDFIIENPAISGIIYYMYMTRRKETFMKKYLIPREGRFYKANLHCHSTISDGRLSPEELKALYKSNGYSVLSITDHEVLIDHSYLNDADFLTITGYEIAVTEDKPGPFDLKKTCHLNLFATRPDIDTAVCFNPDYCWCISKEIIDRQKYKGGIYHRTYSPETINHIIEEANNSGFIVQYNHPAWSLEDAFDFCRYKGFFAMEIYNTGCAKMGISEYNIKDYDTYLRQAGRIFCTANDDCHSMADKPAALSDYFGGFTMIKAEKLTYSAVMDSLIKGNFYASFGPYINELYVEDGKAYIKCSDARYISMTTQGRRAKLFAAENGRVLNEAVFDIHPMDGYIRFDVTDSEGRHANTRAYFLDEFTVE